MAKAKFLASKGKEICPKCFGDTEIDLTPRDATGWPLGDPKRMTCDHCDGEGELEPGRTVELSEIPPGVYSAKIAAVNEAGVVVSLSDVKPVSPGWPSQAPAVPPSTGSNAGWPMFQEPKK